MIISITNSQKKHKLDVRRFRKNFNIVLRELGCGRNSEVSILFVGDEQIREINKIYLQRDRPTNVISFSMADGACSQINPHLLGDIIISLDTAFRDGEKEGLDFMAEVEFLAIHGLLHLLGYEHEDTCPDKARKMRRREQELFRLLGHGELDNELLLSEE